MAEENELLEVEDIPVEECAGIDADNAEDVVIDFSWQCKMEKKLKLVSANRTESSLSFTFDRVPASIRKHDHAAYTPQIVSIGPFHRGRKNLRAMEEHKWRYVHEVLAFGSLGNNLEKVLKEMKKIETQVRICYSRNIKIMSSEEFVEMMLLDGCLIIFLILGLNLDASIDGNESIWGTIKIDMLLLENQLPFTVLERLWELIGERSDALRNNALKSFEHFFQYKLELKSPEEDVIHHLLHLLDLSLKPDSSTRKSQTTSDGGKLSSPCLCQHIDIGKTLCLCPTYLINTYHRFRTPSQQSLPESDPEAPSQQSLPESDPEAPSQQSLPESDPEAPKPLDVIPSATELQEAGVRFHLLKQARSFFEVGFEQGLMKMPRLSIDDWTKILFRNLIAFEQCYSYLGNHLTTYCVFIDFLVNTPRDVSILREADIIRNGLGSNEEAALFFNKLCKDIVWSAGGTYLADLFEEVNQHTQKRCPRWRAKLVRDYFGNPWAIISVIAALIIFILTFLQTYFSAASYFNPTKP